MLKKLSRLMASARKHMPVLASTAILCCGLSSTAEAIPFGQISQIYFFGDSLTDSGFNDLWGPPAALPLPAGKAPTFTTFGGYTWSQYVARDVKGFVLPVYPISGGAPNPADTITNNAIPGLIPTAAFFVSGTKTGINYACAGATTNSGGNGEAWAPSLTQQVNYYLSSHGNVADPNAVYFVWAGANDLLTLIPTDPTVPLPSQQQLLLTSITAATNIANSVTQLANAGAKRIVVMALPNVGLTPLVSAQAAARSMPSLPADFKTATFTFNSMLNTTLGGVISRTGVKILYVDVYDLLDNVILSIQAGQPYAISGQSFPFINYTGAACLGASSAIYCPSTAPTGFVFADVLHPTDMAHRVLSLQVEAQLQSWG